MTGIPVHHDPTYDNRTIPTNPKPFPYSINGNQVIAAAMVPARTGEMSNLAVMVVREDSRPPLRAYAVLDASAADTHNKWACFNGAYDCSYAEAMEIFRERLNDRT